MPIIGKHKPNIVARDLKPKQGYPEQEFDEKKQQETKEANKRPFEFVRW